jgi:ribosomal protein L2
MLTDRIMNLFTTPGHHDHVTWKHAKIFTDTPPRTLAFLRRAVETDNLKGTITVELNGFGEVKDAPFIELSANTILIIGDTWTAELTIDEPVESEAADA